MRTDGARDIVSYAKPTEVEHLKEADLDSACFSAGNGRHSDCEVFEDTNLKLLNALGQARLPRFKSELFGDRKSVV